jgi:hypothetical protein
VYQLLPVHPTRTPYPASLVLNSRCLKTFHHLHRIFRSTR